jgi:hypothetical protein
LTKAINQHQISKTIDYNNKPTLKITRSKESWKSALRIAIINDYN